MSRISLPLRALVCALALPLAGWAGTIKGRVTDARTGEPLVGAVVFLQGTSHNGQVQLDGTFVLRDVPTGEYELVSQYISYAAQKSAR